MREFRSPYLVPSDFWMYAFSDLLTLLLIFFVLRLSTKSLEDISLDVLSTQGRAQASTAEGRKLTRKLASRLSQAAAAKDGALQGMRLMPWRDGTLVSLTEATFLPGSDELSPIALEAVRLLAGALKDRSVEIIIDGHTDDLPIATERFPSNWELSAARAISVAETMVSSGIKGSRISAVGYADTRPLANNQESSGRVINRRVEIYVLPTQ